MECEETAELGEFAPDYDDEWRQDLGALNIGSRTRGAGQYTL
jgi:hypothetical protein